MTLTTTLNRIRAHSPCKDDWRELLAGLGKTSADDDPLPYARIVEINGIDDALWATRAEPQYAKEWRLFAVWCAREALKYTDDWRAVFAVQVAERFAHGMASGDQLNAASNDAWAAAWAASAAKAAAWAASAARNASDASDARTTAWAASDASAASAASAARDAQTSKFLEIVS